MKINRISYLLFLPWTITFGLQCAATSEAFLRSTSLQYGSPLRMGRKNQLETTKKLTVQRIQPSRLNQGRINESGAALRGFSDDNNSGAVEANNRKQVTLRELLAEVIGTFLIVQIGTGAVMSALYTNSLMGLFQIASVWIIAVTVAICTTASISGAHLNPAISIAFAAVRPSENFTWRKVIPYSAAQLLGAGLGSATNLILYGSLISTFEANNGIVRASSLGIASAKAFGEYFVAPVSMGVAFLAETIGTAILSFVIFSLTNEKNDGVKDSFIPPMIGLTVGALIAVLAPLTQAGFNPARDFGPRIVAWCAGWKTVAFTGWWVYIIGPIVGALLGAYVADKILYPDSLKHQNR
ncbi:MIP family channel protein [Nitzschia inconspicua]|uniref:MIP family channel protein n=1 Tax=Nitzschia inconspicua TaxID=303405 RepID=A0A9K3PQT1_9STRA|nr:MIP family channel protein [Nitzschia inconspicua]